MIRRSLFAAILGMLMVGAGAGVAVAHDTLLESEPGHGEHVDDSPEEIVLTYDAHILDVSPAIVLIGPDGEVEVGQPQVVGTQLLTEIPPLDDGNYTVNWRVVSSDGHPISGTFEFAVGDAPPPAADGTGGQEAAADAAADNPGGGANSGWIIAAAGAIAVVGVIALVVARRPRSSA